MRVAVLASGFLYNALESAEAFKKHLIEPNKADVFLFTSRENFARSDGGVRDRADVGFSGLARLISLWGIQRSGCAERPDYQDELAEQYAAYAKRLEGFRPRHKPEYVDQAYRASTIDQYLRLKWCWRLMEEHERRRGWCYDVVVRARPDLVFETDVNICDTGSLHVPCKSHFYHCHHNRNYLKEFLFYARRDVFAQVASWVDHYGGLIAPLFELGGADYTLCPEYQFYLLAKRHRFAVQFIPVTCVVQQKPFAYRIVLEEPDAEGCDEPDFVQL